MQKLAVIPTATSVLRTELMQLHQMRGKCNICAFFTKCPCGEKVDYTNNMIRDTLVNGIADTDIRREVLGSTDIITTAINDIIALVESKSTQCHTFNFRSQCHRYQASRDSSTASTNLGERTSPLPFFANNFTICIAKALWEKTSSCLHHA